MVLEEISKIIVISPLSWRFFVPLICCSFSLIISSLNMKCLHVDFFKYFYSYSVFSFLEVIWSLSLILDSFLLLLLEIFFVSLPCGVPSYAYDLSVVVVSLIHFFFFCCHSFFWHIFKLIVYYVHSLDEPISGILFSWPLAFTWFFLRISIALCTLLLPSYMLLV